MGSQKVLEALHGNTRYFALPVDVVNNGRLLWHMPNLMATNGALAFGLNGLPNAFMRGPTIYSGIGGANDFITAARQSPGGKAVIGLPATYRDKDGTHSRIVPEVSGGVTTAGQNITHVVTQHGIASLVDTERNRAAALIGVADPAFRPWLQGEFDKQMAARVDGEAAEYEQFQQKKESSK
jgi:acyl-CoA hydrolase